MGQIRERG